MVKDNWMLYHDMNLVTLHSQQINKVLGKKLPFLNSYSPDFSPPLSDFFLFPEFKESSQRIQFCCNIKCSEKLN